MNDVSVATLTLEAPFVVLSLSRLKSISCKRERLQMLGTVCTMVCTMGQTSCEGRGSRNGDQKLISFPKLERQIM